MPRNPSTQPNPYETPTAALHAPSVGATDDELSAFVGPNSNRYLSQWRRLRTGFGRTAGFNWSAFLAGPFWCAYRRMYREAAGIFGVVLIMSMIMAIAETLLVALGVAAPVASLLMNVVSLLLSVSIGIAANPWYLRTAERAISEVRPPDLDAIARRGGVRPRAAVGLLLILGVLGLVIMIVGDTA